MLSHPVITVCLSDDIIEESITIRTIIEVKKEHSRDKKIEQNYNNEILIN